MREDDDPCSEMRFIIKGRDFCIDLYGILDVFRLINEMMIRGQSLNLMLWDMTTWWPKVKQVLAAQAENLRE
ncbi:hypothetical protein FJT64_023406 [Amphibalanus amphitrite]|uniref:Uncharacterized protein n=1 Tax=Amphibalanus amphitrite TaxID=1232801 RepID=A0A6A4WHY9_AMPAM|nr:hypothetical protein FJT64_023406 [Amphibalanus amphitrite]